VSAARFLPYGRQCIEADDIEAVANVLRGDWLTTGPKVGAFEAALAETTGAGHVVACANGTAALHLATLALGLGPGDVAIVPSLTFVATANAVRFVGADVVFADVDPATGLLTPDALEEALALAGGRACAVLPVHLNGQCADLAGIKAIADRHGLAIVEDACHALGGQYRFGNRVGPVGDCAFGDMAVFSFHPVKGITMGEGGAVTARDGKLAERLRLLRSHHLTRDPADFVQEDLAFDARGQSSRRPNPWYYEQQGLGWNYRASDINCALGLSQLAKLPRFMGERRRLAARYDADLAALSSVVRPVGKASWCCSGWHLYAVHVDFAALGLSRAQAMEALKQRGIGTQVHYIPVHRQPYYRSRGYRSLPGADAYYASCLTLPLFVGMTEADVDRVVEALRDLASAPRS
jgi:UDP-4-amino-4,6-dideoxy-N-acetyl-beta-L-altrosamine transaminase